MLKRLFWFRHEHNLKKLMKTGLQIGKDTLVFNEAEDYGTHHQMVTIGSHCVIASGVQFITNPAILRYADVNGGTAASRIIICDNCFLGMNSIIYPNVVIGPNAIVGAGAVVMEDVPPNMCASGNPSHTNCTVDFYRSICKKGIIEDYTPENKREVLQMHFWNNTDTGV